MVSVNTNVLENLDDSNVYQPQQIGISALKMRPRRSSMAEKIMKICFIMLGIGETAICCYALNYFRQNRKLQILTGVLYIGAISATVGLYVIADISIFGYSG